METALFTKSAAGLLTLALVAGCSSDVEIVQAEFEALKTDPCATALESIIRYRNTDGSYLPDGTTMLEAKRAGAEEATLVRVRGRTGWLGEEELGTKPDRIDDAMLAPEFADNPLEILSLLYTDEGVPRVMPWAELLDCPKGEAR